MHRLNVTLLAAMLSTIISCVATAQLNEWERTHPDGPDNNLGGFVGEVSASSDGVAYMTSSFERYYSRSDSASVWESYTPRLDGQAFEPLRFYPHPSIGGRVLANGPGGSVVRSLDYGRNWTTVSAQNGLVIMTTSPLDPNVFFAGDFQNSNLNVSSDGGVTWTATPMTGMSFMSDLEIDSTNINTMYALDGQRIKKSTNAGATWEIAEDGTDTFWYMEDLAIDPNNPQNLYAASGASAFAFSTNDGAANWNFIGLPTLPGTGSPMNEIKVDPTNSARVFTVGSNSSIFSTSDAGISWQAYTESSGNNDWYRISISNTGETLLGGSAGVAMPGDNNALELSNQGYSDFGMTIIARVKGDTRYRYGGGRNGIAVHDTINDTWRLLDRPFDNSVRGIAVDPENSEHLYVASFFGGLHESTDAGLTWQEIPLPEGSNFGLDIAIAPSDSEVLYLRSGLGLYRSGDGGANWALILGTDVFNVGGVPYPIEVSPLSPNIVSVGTFDSGILTTLDGGQSWKSTEGLFPDDFVSAIATDPRNPSTIYATLIGGYILKSTDSGENWALFNTSGLFGSFLTIAVDHFVPGRLFVFNSSERMYVYEPSNDFWSSTGSSLGGSCGSASCQILPDYARQGYITVQRGGELFSLQRDADNDQLGDDIDNCTLVQNSNQRDTDADGYGNYCDPDFNNDQVVNFVDVAYFASVYLTDDADADMTGDGVVNFIDFALVRDFYLMPPGPGANGIPD